MVKLILLLNLSQVTITVNNFIIIVLFQTDPIKAVRSSTLQWWHFTRHEKTHDVHVPIAVTYSMKL